MPRLDYAAVPTCQPASRRAKGNKHPRFVLLSNQREKERGMKRLKGNGSLAEGKIMSSDNLTQCRVGLNLSPTSLSNPNWDWEKVPISYVHRLQ